MTHTSIAVFETFSDAELAAKKLIETGILTANVEIYSKMKLDRRQHVSGMAPLKHDTSLWQKTEQFFARLFNTNDHAVHSSIYNDALNDGHVLLSVENVPDEQIYVLDALLLNSGALTINDRSNKHDHTPQNSKDSVIAGIPREVLPHFAFGKTVTPSGKAHLYETPAGSDSKDVF